MKKSNSIYKFLLTTLFFTASFCISASEIPDPEIALKQYLKDLCTLNEQEFTRKYMFMQVDAEFIMQEMQASYMRLNETDTKSLSDTLSIRSKVHMMVVKSYRSFKMWQHENNIDSSKIVYNSCEVSLKKERRMPFYSTDNTTIFFSIDTVNYGILCDHLVFLNNKWKGGDIDAIVLLDTQFNYTKSYYKNDYKEDSIAARENGRSKNGDNAYLVPTAEVKIKKRMDAHYRRIEELDNKRYRKSVNHR